MPILKPSGRHGVLLGDQQFPVGVAVGARGVILVESVEHGRELQARLLGWPLLHAEDGGGAGQSPWERAFRTVQPVPEQAIATIIRAVQFPQFDTDVLIMATGRKAPVLPAGFPPLAASGERRRTLIIDIDDDFDRAARGDARERVNYYLGRGFAVDAVHGPDRPAGGGRHESLSCPPTTDDSTGVVAARIPLCVRCGTRCPFRLALDYRDVAAAARDHHDLLGECARIALPPLKLPTARRGGDEALEPSCS